MNHEVVKIKFGSHLYGTNLPTSDIDFKSVFIPTREEILLQRVPGSRTHGPSKKEDGIKNAPGDIDEESYSLQRYLSLLMDGQTVAIDMLFAPDENLISTSPTWDYIRFYKERFLTKKSAAFLGYCRQQANKYGIKGSRVAAARVASNAFNGIVEYGKGLSKLSEWNGALEQLVREHPEHLAIIEHQVGSSGETGLFFECCGRKISYTSSIKQAAEVFTKIFENYGARAKQAEANEGVDWKALSHAVRVGNEALELLYTGNVTLPLSYGIREQVLDIKQGKLPYQEVADIIEELLARVEIAAVESKLRDVPDYAFADGLVYDTHCETVTEGYRL